MRERLHRAAGHFAVVIDGEPVFGWRERTISARVSSPTQRHWLRVVAEMSEWAHGDWWEGNYAAAAIRGVAKPTVLAVHDWRDDTERARLRAELMTLAPDPVCSPTQELRHLIRLDDSWWKTLRASLDALAAWPTTRMNTDTDTVRRRLLAFYGDGVDPVPTGWTTAHGDLHWNNLTAPELAILDWEGWGVAPAGLDPATLYCHSLLVPEVAERVRAVFGDILDTADGARAQLYAIARLLRRVDAGDYPDIAGPLHRHARRLLAARLA